MGALDRCAQTLIGICQAGEDSGLLLAEQAIDNYLAIHGPGELAQIAALDALTDKVRSGAVANDTSSSILLSLSSRTKDFQKRFGETTVAARHSRL